MKFSFPTARLIGLRHNVAVRAMSGAFALRVGITIANLGLVTLAARMLSGHDFGTYSMLFSAAGLLSVVATLGQQIFITRSWSEFSSAGDQQTLKGAMTFTALASLAGVILVGLPFFVWFLAQHDAALTVAATLYLICYSLMLTSAHLARGAVGVWVGDGLTYLPVALCPMAYLAVCYVLGFPIEIYRIFLCMAAASSITVIIQMTLLRRRVRAQFPEIGQSGSRFEFGTWIARSTKLWISSGLEAANQYADVVIIGYLMSPTIAGAYFVTTRIANAFATATGAVYIFSTRHFPNLYYNRQYRQLDSLLDSVALITLAIVTAGLVVVIGGGHWILLAFNADYVPYYGALALLTIGTAAVAAAGPSGSILMLTGHEGTYLTIVGGTFLMRAVGFFVLIPMFGITGAVAATTISFVTLALLLRGAAKSMAGIDGSVLRLLTRLRRDPVSLRPE
ncbi:polysaccharide biosynthesis C-terminal domain-containing protein [Rhodopseudomonas sp. HC1]|uniref:lipopolysaccharide biosynthesis protein n=1 Tax=Rhodopseudomonas infernalis TaxID=2897386 RepID=UPI001EE877A7|nr:polysaccharide biosynthesis C-terminal domain-containing protein [Rhodopseudomonas infernalis]MCG6205619.1 polysaccharide biosynthesis C-terminal domain-containing protein [Rhodopseudomonas infernalis]